jgi:hypothetical protein
LSVLLQGTAPQIPKLNSVKKRRKNKLNEERETGSKKTKTDKEPEKAVR